MRESTHLSRRAAIKGLSVAAVTAGMPASAAAGAHPDAELLALREPYERTLAAADALAPAHTRAEEAVIAIMREQPDRDRAEVEREVGLDVAAARWEAALDVNGEVIEQIIDIPARTIEGLIFKARICEREDMNADLAASIVSDLVAMGGAHA